MGKWIIIIIIIIISTYNIPRRPRPGVEVLLHSFLNLGAR